MPVHYTCYCGIYVHPTMAREGAIHSDGCPYKKVFPLKAEDALKIATTNKIEALY